jgi:hypothetical protein
VQPPADNAHAVQEIQDEWRREHERELEADFDDNPFDFLDDTGYQALDDVVAQALAQEQEPDEHAAQIYGANLHFENQRRRDLQENDDPEVQQRPNPPRRDGDMPKACRQYREPEPNQRHNFGLMNIICTHCEALHWIDERLSKSSIRNPKFGVCCLQGQIQLPPLRHPPRYLCDLLCGVAPMSKIFRDKIYQYNAAFAFTSWVCYSCSTDSHSMHT